MIYCVVCHDPLGTGHGKIVERGYTPPPSYHIERLRKAPVGHLFAVISEGYGSMPSYAAQIPVARPLGDRGLSAGLQASQHFPEAQAASAKCAHEHHGRAGTSQSREEIAMSSAACGRSERIVRWQRRSLAVGVVALVVCIIGAVLRPVQFFRAYLPAYLFSWEWRWARWRF